MVLNPANVGYLPGLIIRELKAGRTVEVTGSIFAIIKDRSDYKDRKYRLIGKFGEAINRKRNGVVQIATREMPEWAAIKMHEVVWDCDEMLRWQVEINER
jgi:hypothetical protein